MKIKIKGYLKNLPYRLLIIKCNRIIESKIIYNNYELNIDDDYNIVLTPIYEGIYPKYIKKKVCEDLSFYFYLFHESSRFTLIDKYYKLKLKGEINLWQNTQLI